MTKQAEDIGPEPDGYVAYSHGQPSEEILCCTKHRGAVRIYDSAEDCARRFGCTVERLHKETNWEIHPINILKSRTLSEILAWMLDAQRFIYDLHIEGNYSEKRLDLLSRFEFADQSLLSKLTKRSVDERTEGEGV